MDLDFELLNVVKHCDMDYAGNLSDLKNKLDGFSMRNKENLFLCLRRDASSY